MAYLNFSPLEGETRTATASDAGRFSSTELRVIDLAERFDAQREIAPESRIGRFMERALGIRLARPLADPRLDPRRRRGALRSGGAFKPPDRRASFGSREGAGAGSVAMSRKDRAP
jgi:hypothetical protein